MKKKISILILPAICTSLVSCIDELDCKQVTLDGATLELSVKSVGFPVEGGSRSVLVATNQETWNIDNDIPWIHVVKEERTATIQADPIQGRDALSGFLYFSAGKSGNMARDSVFVMQSGFRVTDLSENGTANCYIAHPGNDYVFDATVKGNGTDVDGTSNYILAYGIGITGGTYADLLWEAALDGDKTRSRDIIGYPVFRDGDIYFSTLGSAGNGVIALKNSAGEVLWSWHIWVTEDEVATSEAVIEGVSWVWMDRNLGAENNIPKNAGNRGLLYQSGRKDPFLPSMAPPDADNPDVMNYNTGKGSGLWNYAYEIPPNFNPPANIPVTVHNPMAFLSSNPNISIYTDWYLPYSGQDAGADSHLWGTYPGEEIVKTIFDPCPPGYTIPPIEAIAGSMPTPITDMWRYEADDDGNFWGFYWKDGTDDYFPFTGRYYYTDGGHIGDSGNYGSYWTRHSVGEGNTGTVGVNMWSWVQVVPYPVVGYIGLSRPYGNAIRCIAEK